MPNIPKTVHKDIPKGSSRALNSNRQFRAFLSTVPLTTYELTQVKGQPLVDVAVSAGTCRDVLFVSFQLSCHCLTRPYDNKYACAET